MESKKIEREQKTIEKMLAIYCAHHHTKQKDNSHINGSRGQLCATCQKLLEYAHKRLQACPHGEDKPVCGNCKIHCYKPDMREQVRVVMRYAGPRMIWNHPIAAIRHLIDSKRRP